MADEIDTPDPATGKSDAEVWREMGFGKAGNEAPVETKEEKPADPAPAGEEKTPEPAPAPDPWASAPEDLRSWKEQAEQKIKSLEHGNASLRGRLKARPHRPAASPEAAPALAAPAASPQPSEASKKFAEDYPDIAAPVLAESEALRKQLSTVEQRVAAIDDDRREDSLAEQRHLLDTAFPDWLELSKDQRLGGWLEQQPRHIREAAGRNATAITDAEEAADVIGRFKAWVEHVDGKAKPPAAPAAPATKPAQLPDRRQHQLESAVTVRGRGPAAATSAIPETGTDEELWKAFSRAGAFKVR